MFFTSTAGKQGSCFKWCVKPNLVWNIASMKLSSFGRFVSMAFILCLLLLVVAKLEENQLLAIQVCSQQLHQWVWDYFSHPIIVMTYTSSVWADKSTSIKEGNIRCYPYHKG